MFLVVYKSKLGRTLVDTITPKSRHVTKLKICKHGHFLSVNCFHENRSEQFATNCSENAKIESNKLLRSTATSGIHLPDRKIRTYENE